MQPDGSVSEIILFSLNPLITMVNVGDLVEVDQWVPTDSFSSTNNQAAEIAGNSSMADFVGSGKFGATIIDALHSLDLIPAN